MRAPAEYYSKFTELLKDNKTYLARIHPDKNCFGEKVVSVDKANDCAETIPLLGNGSFYSFRLKVNAKSKD